METINNSKIRYQILAFVLTFMVAIAPLGNVKKVKAIAGVDDLAILGGAAIIALIISGLVAQGAISGDYQVSGPDISSICEKAQANLQAAGSAAIDQANKLGSALAAGAESAKIKALASGAVIYAFLQAIQETLFPDRSIPESELPSSIKGTLFATLGDYNFYYEVLDSALLAKAPFPVYVGWRIGNIASYGTELGYISKYEGISSYTPENICFVYVLNTLTNNQSGYLYYDNGGGKICMWRDSAYNPAEFTPIMDALLNVSAVHQNAVYDNSYVSNLQHHKSVTVPTVLPQTIINNINNWDGTRDLVLAPPLPYDIPTGEDLVIDPSYVGEGNIDPPKPTTDPDPPAEEEGISLPWLSALLALLGLGQIGGIDAGIQSGIDSIIDGITATAQDVYDGAKDIAGTITGALSGIDATVQSGIDALTGTISVPLANVSDFVLSVPDFFAIPEGVTLATPIIEQIPQVFPIVDQINTALNKITVETRPLIIYYPYLDGSTKRIDLEWYEPAREQVKHGVGLLFKVVTALACFAMVSNVFGIGLRVGTGQAYSDRPGENSSGGRKKED